MAIFMENYKNYCRDNGYKQKFVALKTGMTEAKVSRLLKREQEVNEQDMELLSEAFMKDPGFFLCRKTFMKNIYPRNFRCGILFGRSGRKNERVYRKTD